MVNNVDDLVKSLKKSEATSGHIAPLEQQLSKISEQDAAAKKQDDVAQVNWRNRQVIIKSDKVAKGIAKAEETTKQEQEQFDRVLTGWADAEKLVKKALKENKEATAKVASSKSAKSTEELQFIQSYVSYNLYSRSIQRNVRLVAQGDKNTPQENVRLYDDILKVYIKYEMFFFYFAFWEGSLDEKWGGKLICFI